VLVEDGVSNSVPCVCVCRSASFSAAASVSCLVCWFAMRVLRRLHRALTATPLGLAALCAVALMLGAFSTGPIAFISYGAMLIALLVLSKAAKYQDIDAAGMAAGDATWRAHIQTLRTLPFSAVHAPEGSCPLASAFRRWNQSSLASANRRLPQK